MGYVINILDNHHIPYIIIINNIKIEFDNVSIVKPTPKPEKVIAIPTKIPLIEIGKYFLIVTVKEQTNEKIHLSLARRVKSKRED